MRLIFITVPGIILLIVLVAFTVANRQTLSVSLDPVPLVVDMPVYLLFYAGLFLGLGLTALVMTWRTTRLRYNLRQARKSEARLREKLDKTLAPEDTGIEKRLTAIDAAQTGPGRSAGVRPVAQGKG